MSYKSLLINTCKVKRYTESGVDDYGNPVKVWSDIYTNEPCRLSANRGLDSKDIKIGAEVVISNYKVYLRDIDITAYDRIEISGKNYEVLLATTIQDGLSVSHKECAVRIVE